MKDNAIILGFEDSQNLTNELSNATGLRCELIQVHCFPDGESKLTLPVELPPKIYICRSLHYPNNKIIELIFAAEGAKNAGAKEIILIAPYLCYMRQDMAFHPGEVVSQHIFGKLIAEHFDAVLTIEAHLHRIKTLNEVFPLPQAHSLSSAELISDFLRLKFPSPLIVGPDEESKSWIAEISMHSSHDYHVCKKQRVDDHHVEIHCNSSLFHNRDIIVVDDVASTGHTLKTVIQQIKMQTPKSVSVFVTHALFAENGYERIMDTGIDNIWSCNSIPHVTNSISIVPLLSAAILGASPQ